MLSTTAHTAIAFHVWNVSLDTIKYFKILYEKLCQLLGTFYISIPEYKFGIRSSKHQKQPKRLTNGAGLLVFTAQTIMPSKR